MITELLEGELDSSTERQALEHLATCSRCAQVLASTRQVVMLTKQHGAAPWPVSCRDRVLGSLLSALDLNSHVIPTDEGQSPTQMGRHSHERFRNQRQRPEL